MNQSNADSFVGAPVDVRTQCAALCWRLHRGKVQVLLITSRETGRWVIPKGWPMPGLSPAKTAAMEAWEEAGVTGVVGDREIGSFAYIKVLSPNNKLSCDVAVYGLRVTALAHRFPERKERRRRWFGVEKAVRRVAEPGLREIILRYAPQ